MAAVAMIGGAWWLRSSLHGDDGAAGYRPRSRRRGRPAMRRRGRRRLRQVGRRRCRHLGPIRVPRHDRRPRPTGRRRMSGWSPNRGPRWSSPTSTSTIPSAGPRSPWWCGTTGPRVLDEACPTLDWICLGELAGSRWADHGGLPGWGFITPAHPDLDTTAGLRRGSASSPASTSPRAGIDQVATNDFDTGFRSASRPPGALAPAARRRSSRCCSSGRLPSTRAPTSKPGSPRSSDASRGGGQPPSRHPRRARLRPPHPGRGGAGSRYPTDSGKRSSKPWPRPAGSSPAPTRPTLPRLDCPMPGSSPHCVAWRRRCADGKAPSTSRSGWCWPGSPRPARRRARIRSATTPASATPATASSWTSPYRRRRSTCCAIWPRRSTAATPGSRDGASSPAPRASRPVAPLSSWSRGGTRPPRDRGR